MTAPQTAVAKTDPLAEQRAKHIAELRERNAHAAAIRGTQWGASSSPKLVAAVAHYCTIHGLDPARHVEVLGDRIYLTGEFYEEKGVPFVLDGRVVVSAPDFVQHDARLQKVADTGDAETKTWALSEINRRMRTRIELGIPDDATGACVIRARVGETYLVGFNWCGGATKTKKKKDGTVYRHDPVGDAEPTKTAQSRAKRRMWRQIVVAFPEMQSRVGAIEASAKMASEDIAEIVNEERAEIAASPNRPAALTAGGYDGEAPNVPTATPATEVVGARTAEDEAFERSLDD